MVSQGECVRSKALHDDDRFFRQPDPCTLFSSLERCRYSVRLKFLEHCQGVDFIVVESKAEGRMVDDVRHVHRQGDEDDESHRGMVARGKAKSEVRSARSEV